jgi:hypothetical protein
MKLERARRLFAAVLAGILAAAMFAGAMHVHREFSGNRAGGPSDTCALCSLSHQTASPAASNPEPRPVRVSEPEAPLPSFRIPVDPTPDRAPARAPPAA